MQKERDSDSDWQQTWRTSRENLALLSTATACRLSQSHGGPAAWEWRRTRLDFSNSSMRCNTLHSWRSLCKLWRLKCSLGLMFLCCTNATCWENVTAFSEKYTLPKFALRELFRNSDSALSDSEIGRNALCCSDCNGEKYIRFLLFHIKWLALTMQNYLFLMKFCGFPKCLRLRQLYLKTPYETASLYIWHIHAYI